MSRGFACALAGIGMTLFAWYGPWAWPAWPAFAVIQIVFKSIDWNRDLSFAQRATVLVALTAVNSGFWAGVLWTLWTAAARAAVFPRARK